MENVTENNHILNIKEWQENVGVRILDCKYMENRNKKQLK